MDIPKLRQLEKILPPKEEQIGKLLDPSCAKGFKTERFHNLDGV